MNEILLWASENAIAISVLTATIAFGMVVKAAFEASRATSDLARTRGAERFVEESEGPFGIGAMVRRTVEDMTGATNLAEPHQSRGEPRVVRSDSRTLGPKEAVAMRMEFSVPSEADLARFQEAYAKIDMEKQKFKIEFIEVDAVTLEGPSVRKRHGSVLQLETPIKGGMRGSVGRRVGEFGKQKVAGKKRYAPATGRAKLKSGADDD